MVVIFLFTLAGGIMLVLSTARVQDIAWKFLRLIAVLSLALAAFALALTVRVLPTDAKWMGVALAGGVVALSAAVAMLFAPWAARHAVGYRILLAIAGAAGVVGAWLAGRVGGWEAQGTAVLPALLGGLNYLLAGALLGSITVAWLLGHAYLTATRMTIAPLRHFSRALLIAAGARGAFLVLAVALGSMTMGGGAFGRALYNEWLTLSLRVGLGIVAVGIFAYMVADCVRLRATQSATGILYFGSLFAYVGELAALHASAQLRWPL